MLNKWITLIGFNLNNLFNAKSNSSSTSVQTTMLFNSEQTSQNNKQSQCYMLYCTSGTSAALYGWLIQTNPRSDLSLLICVCSFRIWYPIQRVPYKYVLTTYRLLFRQSTSSVCDSQDMIWFRQQQIIKLVIYELRHISLSNGYVIIDLLHER